MAQTVIGIFDSANDAQNAVQQLVSHGFSRNNIDLATRSSSESDVVNRNSNSDSVRDDDNDSFGDSIGRFFSNLFGGDDDEVDRYSKVGRQRSIVTVHAQSEDEAEQAADLLDEYGAIDVNEKYVQARSNLSDSSSMNVASDYTTTDRTDRDFDTKDTSTSIPIIEEDLQVGKRVVQTGGVRLRSRIVERPVEENLRLREEHVRVERHPVNRAATESDLQGFKEGEIELTERAEVPVVNKEARVVEEVNLSKDVEEREETIRDTVRRTDVDIEESNRNDNTRRSTSDDTYRTNDEYRQRENLRDDV